MDMYVCLRAHIKTRCPNFTKISVHIACGSKLIIVFFQNDVLWCILVQCILDDRSLRCMHAKGRLSRRRDSLSSPRWLWLTPRALKLWLSLADGKDVSYVTVIVHCGAHALFSYIIFHVCKTFVVTRVTCDVSGFLRRPLTIIKAPYYRLNDSCQCAKYAKCLTV